MDPEVTDREPMDPRFRARQLEVARQAGRRRLKWILLVAAIVLLFVGGALLIRAPFLSVDQVHVSGAVYTDQAAVADIVDGLKGEPMLTLDTGSVARKLEALPWVLKARVEQDWPRDVRIELAERTPLAVYGATDGQWRVVDEEGRVLAALEGRPVDVLLLTGQGGPALAPGADVAEPLAGAVRIARALPPSLKARTLELAYTTRRAVRAPPPAEGHGAARVGRRHPRQAHRHPHGARQGRSEHARDARRPVAGQPRHEAILDRGHLVTVQKRERQLDITLDLNLRSRLRGVLRPAGGNGAALTRV